MKVMLKCHFTDISEDYYEHPVKQPMGWLETLRLSKTEIVLWG